MTHPFPTLARPGERLRIALGQINATVGDLSGNSRRILARLDEARAAGADLIAFPELAVTGYPPEDLLLKPGFLHDSLEALREIAAEARGITVVLGCLEVAGDIYNSAAVLADGRILGTHRKHYLPNYGVFDEDRYFQRGTEYRVFESAPLTFGVTICEDIWYAHGPAHIQATLGGAQLIVNLNASPYHAGKWRRRERMLATRAADATCYVAYVNLVGGQDELVFDGQSVIFDPRGEPVGRALPFAEDLLLYDLDPHEVLRARLADPRRRKEERTLAAATASVTRTAVPAAAGHPSRPVETRLEAPLDDAAEVYAALVLGTRDYVEKAGFREVLIGISGGIDSALVACVAVDALGAERVRLVSMPSTYSSAATRRDAMAVAERLGTAFVEIPITTLQAGWTETLAEAFAGTTSGVAEENLQSRSRGNILMALSNKFGALVLTTGNKSEMACGYATLYGDMAGGFAVIKDVPKTLVYRLAAWLNRHEERIPVSIIDRPPSAELRPDQKDTDSLPPYEILDPIIHAYVEEDMGLEDMVARGHDEAICRRVILMIDRNEYKRRQAPPGVKITPKAFGRDRRLPITNRYHDL